MPKVANACRSLCDSSHNERGRGERERAEKDERCDPGKLDWKDTDPVLTQERDAEDERREDVCRREECGDWMASDGRHVENPCAGFDLCRVGLTAPGGYRENPECLGNFAVFREIGVSHDPGRDFGSRRHAQ